MPGDEETQRRAQLAREALARAKADARARGQRPAGGGAGRGAAPGDGPQQGPRRRGRRGRREDPQPLAAAIDGLLAERGWRAAAAVGSVFGRWDQIVGPDLAAHTQPAHYGDGELVVTADSTAWATQLRLLAANLVRRLNEELGDGTVTRVTVRGPAPPRRMGPLRVRGTRNTNGDYG